MAMDSYMKGVADSSGKPIVSVRPVKKEQKEATVENGVIQEKAAKKVSVPKSSTRKASVKKSNVKKNPVPKSSVKKAPVSVSSVQKADKVRVENVAGTEQENKEVLFGMEKEPTISTIDSAISSINAQMSKTRCAYAYDEATKRVTIKVYDDETDELIREVPPEKSLDILKRVWERAGIIMDEKY